MARVIVCVDDAIGTAIHCERLEPEPHDGAPLNSLADLAVGMASSPIRCYVGAFDQYRLGDEPRTEDRHGGDGDQQIV